VTRATDRTKTDAVARELRREIASGALAAGNRLAQRDLAERFGTSPTPVREALRQLTAEGLLSYTPNQGVTVADITAREVEELHEIYLMRSALERIATELAHRHLSRAKLEELDQLQQAAAVERRESGDDARALNYSFHMEIYKAAQAPRLLRVIEHLWTLFPWDTLYLHPTGEATSPDEHAAVIVALRTGTAEEAGDAMVRHIQHGYDKLKAHVLYQGDQAVSRTQGRGPLALGNGKKYFPVM